MKLSKIAVLGLSLSLPVIGVVSVALASGYSDVALDGTETRKVKFTTEYFMVEADSTTEVIDVTNDAAVILGKPGGTLVTGTSSNQCGVYDDGFGSYVTSTIGFSGTLYESFVMLLSTNGSKGARIPRSAYFVGGQPSHGKKNTSIAKYYEGGTDDGECVENSKTYHKYSASMD